jgi:hypothetical protein
VPAADLMQRLVRELEDARRRLAQL